MALRFYYMILSRLRKTNGKSHLKHMRSQKFSVCAQTRPFRGAAPSLRVLPTLPTGGDCAARLSECLMFAAAESHHCQRH